MADTVQTRSTLQALYADNVAGDISARDGRDVIVSLFGWFAVVNPTVSNDRVDTAGIGQFFDVGSYWLNTATGITWRCMDGAIGAAVWESAEGPQGPQGPEGPQGDQGDPGEGVPAGGAADQVLAKIDGTDFNTEWVDLPANNVPAGGTADQVLAKINGTDFNTEWVDSPTRTTFSAVLGAPIALTLANGTWQALGLTIAIPDFAMYLITVQCRATVEFSAGPQATISFALFDEGPPSLMPNSETLAVQEPVVNVERMASGAITNLIFLGGPYTLGLRAMRNYATVWTVSQVDSDNDGRTAMTAVKMFN